MQRFLPSGLLLNDMKCGLLFLQINTASRKNFLEEFCVCFHFWGERGSGGACFSSIISKGS